MNLLIILGFMGGYEWVLIILAIVLLFGGKKIPELMKGLGKGMNEFKKAREEVKDTLTDEDSSNKSSDKA